MRPAISRRALYPAIGGGAMVIASRDPAVQIDAGDGRRWPRCDACGPGGGAARRLAGEGIGTRRGILVGTHGQDDARCTMRLAISRRALFLTPEAPYPAIGGGAMMIASKDPAVSEVVGDTAVQIDAGDGRGWLAAMRAAKMTREVYDEARHLS